MSAVVPAQSAKATVLIVEDELITAQSLLELLTNEDYIVTGIATDAPEAFMLCNKAVVKPEVVLCDINIRGAMNGIELAKALREAHGCSVIFITAYSDAGTVQKASATDPVMYLVKPYSDAQVLVALQMAFHKRYGRRGDAGPREEALQLTPREREIIDLIGQGLSSKQIAARLAISDETVKTHRKRILQKSGAGSFPRLLWLLSGAL